MAAENAPAEVRPPSMAGSFYPADPAELEGEVRRLLGSAPQPAAAARPWGLIVPHAAYAYSGAVAAAAYRLLEGERVRTVVLLGPSHHMHFRGVSAGRYTGCGTPLGELPVDQETVTRLIAGERCIGFRPEAHEREHSLEVQLPFIQVLFGSPLIVPILIGDGAFDTCQRLAAALHKEMAGRGALYVASTDLSHYHTYEDAKRIDERTVAAIAEGDPSRFHELAQLGPCELCGASAVTTLLLLSRLLAGRPPVLLSAASSGDVTGSRSRVVGYASLALSAAA